MEIMDAPELEHSASNFHTGCESDIHHGKSKTTLRATEKTHTVHLRRVDLVTLSSFIICHAFVKDPPVRLSRLFVSRSVSESALNLDTWRTVQ